MSSLLVLSVLLAAPSQPFGGGDSCNAPDQIVGEGSFLFDNTAATTGTEGQSESLCLAFGTSGIGTDVWFEWSATADGPVRLYTCSQTGTDTKIAVYPGSGCPVSGSALACNDDTCGLQSTAEWSAVAGEIYTIQLGNFPGAAPGTGSFELFVGGTPANNLALGGIALQSSTAHGGDALRGIDGNTSGTWGNGSCTHTADVPDSWWEVDLGSTAALSSVLLYNRLDCCSGRLSNFRVSVFSGATEQFGQDYYVGSGSVPANGVHRVSLPAGTGGDRVRVKLLGQNNDGNGFLTLAEVEVLSGAVGASYCFCDGSSSFPGGICGNPGASGHGCANGANVQGAHLSATGPPGPGTLVLLGEGAVPGQPGLFFQGDNQIAGGVGISFGDGLRCAGGNAIRLEIVMADATGACQTSIDIHAAGGISAGDVKNYQLWYSDPTLSPCGSLFNLTNGLQIHW